MFNHHLRNEPSLNIDALGFDESDEDEAGKASFPDSASNAGGSKKTGVRVRFQIIRNACTENVGESQSCMVSKVRIIWKQTVREG